MAGKLLKYLPRPTSFSVPSSTSSNKVSAAFSGPIVSIIPRDARRKKKGSAKAFEDPTSPRVSCFGQVSHKKCSSSNNHKKTKKKYQSFNEKVVMKREEETSNKNKKKKHQSFNERTVAEKKTAKKPSAIQGMFRRKVRPGRPPVPERREEEEEVVVQVAPEMGRMRRYASRRQSLGDFDWRMVVVGPQEEEEDEVLVPHSAPMVIGGGGAVAMELEKRKEVNLWKRRTLAPPEPLRV